MKSKKIVSSEISELKISSLPTKPTAPKSMGGSGYGAKEMKEAFDKLPLFIIEKFNALIDDITSSGEDSLAGAIHTGLNDNHTLFSLFKDIKSGEFANYCQIFDESLMSNIVELKTEIKEIKDRLSVLQNANKED